MESQLLKDLSTTMKKYLSIWIEMCVFIFISDVKYSGFKTSLSLKLVQPSEIMEVDFVHDHILRHVAAPWMDAGPKTHSSLLSQLLHLTWKECPSSFSSSEDTLKTYFFLTASPQKYIGETMLVSYRTYKLDWIRLNLPLSLSLALCLSPGPLTQQIVSGAAPEVRTGNVGLLLLYSYRSAVPYRTTTAGL